MIIKSTSQGYRGLQAAVYELAQQVELFSVSDVVAATGATADSVHSAIRYLVNGNRLIRCGRHSAKSRRYTVSPEVAAKYEAEIAPKPISKESLQRKIGACLGAMRTLEDLKARVKIDPDTGCWVWQGAVTKGHKGHAYGVPSAQVLRPDGGRQGTSVQRWAYLQREGKAELEPGYIVWAAKDCCRCCVNPEHMRSGTRLQWGHMIRMTKRWKGLLTYKASAKRIASRRAIVTDEEVQRIQQSGETNEEAAKRLGVTPKTIQRRRSATQLVANCSVFNFRPAANDGKKKAA